MTITEKQRDITGSPFRCISGSSLADVRNKTSSVNDDLVEWPGWVELIFTRQDVKAAELRAALMEGRYKDLVVTLVCNVIYSGPNSSPSGSLWIESLRHSQLASRITELKRRCDGTVKVMMAYSDDTEQMFWWNDLEIDEPPRLPGYDVKYDKKRTGFRSPSSGVNP